MKKIALAHARLEWRRSVSQKLACALACLGMLAAPEALGFSPAEYRSSRDTFPRDLFRTVAIIGTDDRKICSDLAREEGKPHLVRQFRATGEIQCDGKTPATANLVGSTSTIVFAAHSLYFEELPGRNRCELPPQRCVFTYNDGNGERKREIDPSSLRHGVPAGLCRGDTDMDWAVARLTRPIRDAEYYAVPEPHHNEHIEGRLIYQVTREQQDQSNERLLRNPSNPDPQPPCWASACMVRDTIRFEGRAVALTDCDIKGGGSGGANVIETHDRPQIIGVSSGGGTKLGDFQEYDAFGNGTVMVILDGSFLENLVAVLESLSDR